MVVKAILFGSGGVLDAGPPGDRVHRRWAGRLGLSVDQLRQLERDAIGPGWEGGRQEDEIRARFRAATGLTEEEHEQYDVETHEHHRVDPRLRTFIERLRARYKVGVVTNDGARYRRTVARALQLNELVDDVVVSVDVGASKPDPRIYLVAAERLGVARDECVFVDDDDEDVEGAIRAGMRGIRFEDVDSCIAALRAELGVVEAHYRAAGGVVFDDDGRVLVLLRPSRNEIRLPKGHVEEGETDEQCAVREVGEESGYADVDIERDLGTGVVEFDSFGGRGPGLHVLRDEHYYRMRLLSDRPAPRGKGDDQFHPDWLPPRQAADAMTFEVERAWVEKAIGE